MLDSSHSRQWMVQTISRLVLSAPENRLMDFDDLAVFDAPLVAVADGDDPLFERIQDAVTPRHLRPREILRRYAPPRADLADVRVIAWALPFSSPVRRSNRGKGGPSRLYSLARNNGGALNHELRRRLVGALQERGWAAVAPVLTDYYDAFRSPTHTFTSTWSERHVGYVAGLGQFGLNGSLITPLGSNVRLGSVITNLPLEPTRRGDEEHRAPCLELKGDGCGHCIDRCPAGALSPEGLDKSKCYEMRRVIRERHMDAYSRSMHMLRAPIVKSGRRTNGYSLGCALCQCGVPCEGCLPRTPVSRGVEDA